MIIVFYHRIAGFEWVLTREEFAELYRNYRAGKRRVEDYRFLREAYEREVAARRVPATYPFSSWVMLNLAILERGRLIGGIEIRLSKVYYRLMTSVMFYTQEEKVNNRSPNPFADFRAWTIVPDEYTAIRLRPKIFKQLNREAWFLPSLFVSVYRAFTKESVERIAGRTGWDFRKVLFPNVNIVENPAIRIGWEVREIDGSEDEITVEEANYALERIARGAAFFSGDEMWRTASRKYDEWWVKAVEIVLENCDYIKRDFRTLRNFKEYAADRMRSVAEYIEKGDLEHAARIAEYVYAYIDMCVPGMIFPYTEEIIRDIVKREDLGVELEL